MSISSGASARAGGLSKASGGLGSGGGDRGGPSLSLLAEQGRGDADTGSCCFPTSEEGQLYLAQATGDDKPRSSGLAPVLQSPGWSAS